MESGRILVVHATRVAAQFTITPVADLREIPSTPLRAGSSLRLKSGCAQDDAPGGNILSVAKMRVIEMKSQEVMAGVELRVHKFRAQLLAWYDRHARDLPWRESRDPYRVWVSEIMLQQTRVAAVIAHYQEFLRRFPTVEKLARAREASVLAAWSGLGYYRRARMLHAAAKVVVRERCGKFPQRAEELLELPGVGRYTAAAIASIAFGETVAVVDGNVERVLQRFSGQWISGEDLWLAAERLLDREHAGDFNQAMMELGATVCTPRAPACLTCPVVELCATRGDMAGLREGGAAERSGRFIMRWIIATMLCFWCGGRGMRG